MTRSKRTATGKATYGTGNLKSVPGRKDVWRWEIRVRPVEGPSKRISGTFEGKEAQARAHMLAEKTHAEQGTRMDDRTMTVGQLLDMYLDARDQGRRLGKKAAGGRTRALARQYAKYIHASPIAKRKVFGVEPSDVEKFLVDLRDGGGVDGRPLTNAVVKCRILLMQVFDLATRDYHLLRNPARLASLPDIKSKTTGDRDRWEPEEVAKLVSYLEKDNLSTLPMGLLFMLRTGMRRGEAFGLRWADVHDLDTDAPTIRIRKSNSTNLDGSKRITTPKTAKSARPIRLPPAAAAVLRRARDWQAKYEAMHPEEWAASLTADGGERYVFTTKKGLSQHVNNSNKYLRRTCQSLGVTVLSPHATRATFTTAVVNAVPLPLLAKHLGHADISTLQRYYDRSRTTDAQPLDAGF